MFTRLVGSWRVAMGMHAVISPPQIAAGLCVCLTACGGGAAHAANPAIHANADESEMRRLIEQLGDAQFHTRQMATQKLAQLGPNALPWLRNAKQHPDREVQYRATYVISLVADQQREQQLQMLRSGDLSQVSALPGWERFKSIVGDDPVGRNLYADMMSRDWNLVSQSIEHPEASNRAVWTHAYRLSRDRATNRDRLEASTSAILFVVSDRRVDISPQTIELMNRLAMVVVPRGSSELDSPVRRLLTECVVSARDPRSANLYLDLIHQLNLRSGLPLTEKILNSKKPEWEEPTLLRKTFAILAQYGTQKHIAMVQRFMDDARPCITVTRRPNFQSQVRDLALGCVLALAKENPVDYGLNSVPRKGSYGAYYYAQQRIGFASEADRQQAMDKWRRTWTEKIATLPADAPDEAAGEEKR